MSLKFIPFIILTIFQVSLVLGQDIPQDEAKLKLKEWLQIKPLETSMKS